MLTLPELAQNWSLINGGFVHTRLPMIWDQFRMILKIILKKKELSFKLQASSLTTTEGYYRIKIERINMDTVQLKRIADAIEEILRLVKKDMEPRPKKGKDE